MKKNKIEIIGSNNIVIQDVHNSKNSSKSHKPLIVILIIGLIAILFAILLWKQKDITQLLGLDRKFSKSDSSFKILIVPFKTICQYNGKNYDAGYVIKERLENLISKDSLLIKVIYKNDIDITELTDLKIKELGDYHNADMIVYGSYQTSDCSSSGDQICVNYITNDNWNLGKSGFSITDDFYPGGLEELKSGKIQEKVEGISLFLSVIGQQKNLNRREYIGKLKWLLNQNDLANYSKTGILIELGDQLILEGDLVFASEIFQKSVESAKNSNSTIGLIKATQRLGETFLQRDKDDSSFLNYNLCKHFAESLYNRYPQDPNLSTLYAMSLASLGWFYSSTGDLITALKYFSEYSEFAKQAVSLNPKDELLNIELIKSFDHVGLTQLNLGNLDKAQVYFDSSNKLATNLHREDTANLSFKELLGLSYNRLVFICKKRGDIKNALTYASIYNSFLKNLFDNNKDDSHYQHGLSISYRQLADIQLELMRDESAIAYLNTSLDLLKDLVSRYPKNSEYKFSLGIVQSRLGNAYLFEKDLVNSKYYYNNYNLLMNELCAIYPQKIEYKKNLAISFEKLGDVENERSNFKNALIYFEMAKKLYEEILLESPAQIDYRYSVAIIYSRLGVTFYYEKNDKQANIYISKFLLLMESLLKISPESVEYKDQVAFGHYYSSFIKPNQKQAELKKAEKIWQELSSLPFANSIYFSRLDMVRKLINDF